MGCPDHAAASAGWAPKSNNVDTIEGTPAWMLAPGRQAWPAPSRSTGHQAVPHRAGNFFHLHLVSDATGETLLTVARAAAAQYANVTALEHMHPLVRTRKQLDRVLDELENEPGIVLYTLLDRELADPLEE